MLMTSCFVCATLNLGLKKSTGTEPKMWATLVTEEILHDALASFPQIYQFKQAKLIRKLQIQIGLACWNRKI